MHRYARREVTANVFGVDLLHVKSQMKTILHLLREHARKHWYVISFYRHFLVARCTRTARFLHVAHVPSRVLMTFQDRTSCDVDCALTNESNDALTVMGKVTTRCSFFSIERMWIPPYPLFNGQGEARLV